jgi:leucyl-tRNA synthetase
MPLYISNFVLMEFGTGAVVGVPGHDKRDFEFAQEFSLPVARVVLGKNGDTSPITRIEQVQEEEGTMINSGFLNGLDIHQATEKMMDYMEEKGWGKRVVVYHLRDWCVSRQRYWGPPIPMVHCGKCGWLPVREKDLPVLLPDIEDWRPKGEGPSPLARHKDWLKVACPECGGVAQRETDVSDTFLDSAWYFLRYPSTRSARSGQVPFDRGITKKWLPVDMYIGGAEHSVLHLMYARFLTMVFKDLGLVDFDEPFKRFRAHALLISEGAKMSKSRGNIVSPDDYIRLYGCDTLRCYLMFLGRFDQGGDFRDTGITGIWRFLNRVWKLVNQTNILDGKIKTENGRSRTIIKLLNRTIKEVTIDIENLHYNTALAKIMEYLNHLSLVVNYLPLLLRRQALEGLVLLLAPFAPHITEEIWCNVLKNKFSIHCHPWPKFDKKFIKEEETVVIAEVNGKVRAKLNLTTGMALKQEEVQRIALENSRLTKYLLGKKILRTIFVPGKIINFLLK